MTLCACGCGQEVTEGNKWVNGGHAAKWRKQNAGKTTPMQEQKRVIMPPSTDVLYKVLNHNKEDITKYKKWEFWKWGIFKRQPKEKKAKFPSRLLTENEIRELKSKQALDSITDEQKFLKFFSTLPKWTHNKPGNIAYRLAKWKSGNFVIKHVVFVDEDGDNKQAFVPYNQELGFLFTDTGFYDVTLKDTQTIFLDSKKFAPLVNRKNYKDEFEIPEDLANALINIGIGYGQLSQFKALIAEIKKTFMLNLLAYIIVILAFLAIGYVMYADGQHYKAVAEALNNLTVSR